MEDIKPVEKPIVYTEDPFSYNYVALNKSKVDEVPVPGVSDVITDPVSHAIGRELGIEKPNDWNKAYEKIFVITQWAKERSGLTDPQEIIKWIQEKSEKMAELGAKKINSLYNNIMLGIRKGKTK